MQLVQVVPNIYELRRPAEPAVAPLVRLAQAPVTQSRSRIEVSNGDGTAGLARRVGTLFGQHGYAVARLTNLRPFGLRSTRIEYRPGHQAQADAMRMLIDSPVQMTEVASAGVDVRVVLGRDTQRALAQQDAQGSAARVAAR
jgi:hypothetical protein